MHERTHGHESLCAAVFLLMLIGLVSGRPLWDAWEDDLYSKGGLFACAIWLCSVAWAAYRFRHGVPAGSARWIVVAAVLCMVGSIASLRIFHHLALVGVCGGVVKSASCRWWLALAALTWIPASGWIVSRFHPGGMTGWERPALAASALLVSLAPRFGSTQPPNS